MMNDVDLKQKDEEKWKIYFLPDVLDGEERAIFW